MKNQNEKTCIIAMPSITGALQGESLLSGVGIAVRVVKLPAGATKRGCAYGLEIPCRDLNGAAARLEKNGVRHGELIY